MSKKVIALIIAILVIALGCYFVFNGHNKTQKDSSNNSLEFEERNSINNIQEENTSSKKIAVVYFSVTGNTKKVAEYIKEETNADLFEIIPKQKYTSEDLNYNDKTTRATKEQNDESVRPEIENTIDVSDYDVIFIGYPIWWGDVPRIIQTFMENNDLGNKTLIPFCTSGSSSISKSESTLKSYKVHANWIPGQRLTDSKSEVAEWVTSLKY